MIKVFDTFIPQIKKDINNHISKVYDVIEGSNWNKLKSSDLILKGDTAIELGHPSTKSTSYIMWTNMENMVSNNKITVIGPDLDEIKDDTMHYAKITLVKMKEYDDDKAYEMFQEMEKLRLNINLEGYMIRSASQKTREWCRVSKNALKKGFSFQILGSELIKSYKEKDFIEDVEIIFVVGEKTLIDSLSKTGEKVTQTIKALNTIFDDIEYDCDACNFSGICDEIDGIKEIHGKKTQNKK